MTFFLLVLHDRYKLPQMCDFRPKHIRECFNSPSLPPPALRPSSGHLWFCWCSVHRCSRRNTAASANACDLQTGSESPHTPRSLLLRGWSFPALAAQSWDTDRLSGFMTESGDQKPNRWHRTSLRSRSCAQKPCRSSQLT